MLYPEGKEAHKYDFKGPVILWVLLQLHIGEIRESGPVVMSGTELLEQRMRHLS